MVSCLTKQRWRWTLGIEIYFPIRWQWKIANLYRLSPHNCTYLSISMESHQRLAMHLFIRTRKGSILFLTNVWCGKVRARAHSAFVCCYKGKYRSDVQTCWYCRYPSVYCRGNQTIFWRLRPTSAEVSSLPAPCRLRSWMWLGRASQPPSMSRNRMVFLRQNCNIFPLDAPLFTNEVNLKLDDQELLGTQRLRSVMVCESGWFLNG